MSAHVAPEAWRLLGITSLDLYIPILTFVFGEAQVGGECAVVSAHRLTQEFYGLPPDPDLLRAPACEGGGTRTGAHLQPFAL